MRRRLALLLGALALALAGPGPPSVQFGAGGGHIIQDEGTDRTNRARLNFVGSGVQCVDNSGAGATDCTIALSGATATQLDSGEAGSLRDVLYNTTQDVWYVEGDSGSEGRAEPGDQVFSDRFEIRVVDFNADGLLNGADLKIAVDGCGTGWIATSGGCEIVMPDGIFDIATPLKFGSSVAPLAVVNGITLRGQGQPMLATSPPPGTFTGGTLLRWTGGDGTSDRVAGNPRGVIEIEACFKCRFENFTIQTDADGTLDDTLDMAGAGIKLNGDPEIGATNQGVTFSHLNIYSGSGGFVNAGGKTLLGSGIDTGADTITTESAHGFATGAGPVNLLYRPAERIPGTTERISYYVRSLSSTALALYPTSADALADTNRVNLTGTPGAGPHAIDRLGSIGVYTTSRCDGVGDGCSYVTGQNDKMQFFKVWMGPTLGICMYNAAAQAIFNMVEGSSLQCRIDAVRIEGGDYEFRDVLTNCWDVNCKNYHFPTPVNPSNGFYKTLIENCYLETDDWMQTFLKTSGGYTPDATTYAGASGVTVRDCYLNQQSPQDLALFDGALQTDIVFDRNFLNYQDTGSWNVYASNPVGQPWGTLDLSTNLPNTFYRSSTRLSVKAAGHVQVLLPAPILSQPLDYTLLNMGPSDYARCIGTGGHGSTQVTPWPSGTVAATPCTGSPSGCAVTVKGTATAESFSASTALGRTPHVDFATTAATNQGASVIPGNGTGGGRKQTWLGNAMGVGGFRWYAKVGLSGTLTTARFAAGLFSTDVMVETADPSVNSNSATSIYLGCDAAQTTLRACANDASGAASCTDLGSDYPCHTAGAFYELWIDAPAPLDASADDVWYRVHRLDATVGDATGKFTVAGGMPAVTSLLGPAVWLNSGTGANSVLLNFVQSCMYSNN